MSEAEDVCGCLACAALCGVCCVAAAEEDKRERERRAAEAMQLKSPMVQVNPVPVSQVSPRSLKTGKGTVPSAGYSAQATPHERKGRHVDSPPY